MKELEFTSQFQKDVKLMQKRGKDLTKLMNVLSCLSQEEPLPTMNRDHILSGKWINCRDCHIEPDWLLIYRINPDRITLYRTGTHSDLFKKKIQS